MEDSKNDLQERRGGWEAYRWIGEARRQLHRADVRQNEGDPSFPVQDQRYASNSSALLGNALDFHMHVDRGGSEAADQSAWSIRRDLHDHGDQGRSEMALGRGQAYDNEVDCDDIGNESYGGSRACYVRQGGDTSGDIPSRVGADSFVALLLNEDSPHDMNLLEENDDDIDRGDGINCSGDENNDPSDEVLCTGRTKTIW
ncbi:hypothetical protein PC128_g12424 [Phytophthora cactorum]|nr:hypothetical protein PC128_g12424 [Phytophthora cactorum]